MTEKVDYERLEKDGKVKYVRGSEQLMVPSVEACRERLVKLLEQTGGATIHPDVTTFWMKQAASCNVEDKMKSAWANEVFTRLMRCWDELQEPATDLFSGFGL